MLNRVLRGGVTLVARKARFCIRIVNRAGLRAGTFPASGTVGAFGTGVTVSFAQPFISEGIINRAAGYLIALNRACNRIAGFSCGAGSGTPARGTGIGTFVTGYVVNGFTVLIGNKSVSARPAGRCARIVDRANGVVSAVIVIKQKYAPAAAPAPSSKMPAGDILVFRRRLQHKSDHCRHDRELWCWRRI